MAGFTFPAGGTNFSNNNPVTPQNLITNAANGIFTAIGQGFGPQPQNNGINTQTMAQNNNNSNSNGNNPFAFGVGNGNTFTSSFSSPSTPTFSGGVGGGFSPPSFGGFQAQNQNTGFAGFGSSPSTTNFTPAQKFVPQKPLNSKIDGKHVVKCIALLPEYNNSFNKKQLRIKYLQQGGTQTTGNNFTGGFGVPSTSSFGFGVGAAGQKLGASPLVSAGVPATSNPFNFTNTNTINPGNLTFNTNAGFSSPTKPLTTVGQQPQPSSPFAPNNNQSIFGGTPLPNNNTTVNTGGNFTTTGGIFGQKIPNPLQNTNQNIFGNTGSQPNQFSFNAGASQPQPQMTSPITQPQPQGVSYTNPNNYNISIFPPQSQSQPQSPNPQTAFALNNATSTLVNQALGPSNIPYQYPNPYYGGNIFGGQPLINPNIIHDSNGTRLLEFLCDVLNKPEFLKTVIEKNSKSASEFAEQIRQRNGQDGRLLQFGEYEDQGLPYTRGIGKIARPIKFYQKPFLFSENEHNSANQLNLLRLRHRNRSAITNPKPLNYNNNQSILRKSPLDKFQESYDKYHEKTLKQILVKESQMPINDSGFKITPNMETLSRLTPQQLKRLPNVLIENKFGWVRFKNRINLYKKILSECIKISQDSVEILDPDWQGAGCEMCYRNFGNYLSAGQVERKKIERKMKRWAQINGMTICKFQVSTGDVYVEI